MASWNDGFGYGGQGAAEHLRCPVCGKVSPSERFDEDAVAQHTLERLERISYGGRTGFRWERELELSNDDWVALQRSLLAALRRVRDAAAEAGAEVVEDLVDETDDGEE